MTTQEDEAVDNSNEPTFRGETSDAGPPQLDSVAVGRVVGSIEIASVDLVGLVFEQDDIGPVRSTATSPTPSEVGLSVEWEYHESTGVFGCAVSFAIDGGSQDDDAPDSLNLRARFRLIYRVDSSDLSASDFDQFAHWNAVFNAWPYWREVVQSVLARAGIDRVVMPVFRMPRATEPERSTPSEEE